MVPKELTEQQKQRRVTICQDLLDRQDDILGCHHRWWNMGLPIRPWNEVAKCTMEDCQFPMTKNSVSPNQESKQCCWLFLILEGLFIMNLYQLDSQPSLLFGSTGNAAWKIIWKRPKLFTNNSWILHHDNASAHMALSVREILATKQIAVLENPAYSPDLAPSDFFLFPMIKEILKGRHFDDIYDIRSNTTSALKAIPQNQFQNCFDRWTRCWHRCIASQGEYFEGDHGGIQQWGT